MPRDYRGDRPHKTRRKPRQTRKPVTITHLALTVEPEPEPKKLYTAEHRAAYYLQGISHPAHGKMLYEAGIEPHHVVQWTKTGIGIEDYTRMAAIAAVGVTPTAFKDLKMQGLSDRTIIYCFNHNVDTQLIVNWEQARHSSTCTRTSIASCACVILPVETICYLIDRQKTISWLRYAIRLGANAKLINFLAQREIPPAIINTFFSAHHDVR